MRVVVDANVVAAALVQPKGGSARGLAKGDVRFFAPELLVQELREHEDEFRLKATCSRAEWRRRMRGLLDCIELVPMRRLQRHWNHPTVRAVRILDPKDALYVAATLAAKAEFLWTRDGMLLALFPRRAVAVLPR